MNFRKAFRKLNSNRGFTLTETLSTLVIMSLVGIIITAGIITAVRVYREVTEYANAQVLLTNTLTVLNDNLIYAKPDTIKVYENEVSFEHIQNGVMHISAENSDSESGSKKGLCISYGEGSSKTDPEPLVSYEKNEDIYTDWTIRDSDGVEGSKVFTITLKVMSGNKIVVDIPAYKIQTLNSKV